MRRAISILACSILCLAVLALCVRQLSRKFVFPAYRVERLEPPADVIEWSVTARDGVVTRALEIPGPPGGRVFVYFHNNRETMVHGIGLARGLVQRGFGVVLPEYRGYGLSRGEEPSEEGLYADAEAVLERLHARRVGPERVVLCGASLGTGVAAEMARRGRGSRLVLIAPYTSLPDIVTDVVPLLPAWLLMPDHFDTLGKSHDIRVPTLVVHGDADEVIPFWMGRRIAGAITGARFLRIPGGRHGDLFARDPDRLIDAMADLARG